MSNLFMTGLLTSEAEPKAVSVAAQDAELASCSPAGEKDAPGVAVALLTGGDDRSYVLGLSSALSAAGVCLDVIGSNRVDAPELRRDPNISFFNLRGDQREDAGIGTKILRILIYYARLIAYAARARPRVFHILWNNKFEVIDRVVLMLYYRALDKRIAFTAHNVNAGKRDGNDSLLNRLTLRVQYGLCDHIFVHTERMRNELEADFGISGEKVSVIPFGINDTSPTSGLTCDQAKERLGVVGCRSALFFGQIAPYKGLEYLVDAVAQVAKADPLIRLIIAGKVKSGHSSYWEGIQDQIRGHQLEKHIVQRVEFIPDDQVEVYFKAADVVVLPYAQIFQSGVPFLAFSFGAPVIATDVGSLRDNIVEGKTGFMCEPRNPITLAKSMEHYFSSDLFRDLPARRKEIRLLANSRHSWAGIGKITQEVYKKLTVAGACRL